MGGCDCTHALFVSLWVVTAPPSSDSKLLEQRDSGEHGGDHRMSCRWNNSSHCPKTFLVVCDQNGNKSRNKTYEEWLRTWACLSWRRLKVHMTCVAIFKYLSYRMEDGASLFQQLQKIWVKLMNSNYKNCFKISTVTLYLIDRNNCSTMRWVKSENSWIFLHW